MKLLLVLDLQLKRCMAAMRSTRSKPELAEL
jgi:hypothetical protein